MSNMHAQYVSSQYVYAQHGYIIMSIHRMSMFHVYVGVDLYSVANQMEHQAQSLS